MSIMTPPLRAAPRPRWGIVLGALAVLLIGGWFAGKSWLVAYLHGPEFRRFVDARLSETLRAEVECAPLQFDGLNVFCDRIKTRGFEDSPFAEAQLEQARARFSLRRIFARAWELDHLEAQRLIVRLDGTRLTRPSRAALNSQPSTLNSSWLPNRLEVSAAALRELEITWGDLPATAGALSGVAIQATRTDGDWTFDGRGGELVSAGLPTLDVTSFRLRQRDNVVFVNEAKFTGRDGGTAQVAGEIRFGERLDLQGQIDGVELAPILSGDWRLRLHGKMGGDVRVQSPLPASGPPNVSGSLRLTHGQIEALPVLNEIAAFTHSQQFRQLPLTHASGDFRREGERLEVTKLIAESEGCLRLEGGFVLAQGEIDGTFQVGVPPVALQWLPGSQERVFTTARGGYLWAPMRLTGPVEAPSEDLSPRLAAAALQKVEDATNDAIQRSRDALKSALDQLLPLFK
jgi:hypothetical protein